MDSCALCRSWRRSFKPFPKETEARENAKKDVKFTRTILNFLPKMFKNFTTITKPSKCLAKEKENKQTNKKRSNRSKRPGQEIRNREVKYNLPSEYARLINNVFGIFGSFCIDNDQKTTQLAPNGEWVAGITDCCTVISTCFFF